MKKKIIIIISIVIACAIIATVGIIFFKSDENSAGTQADNQTAADIVQEELPFELQVTNLEDINKFEEFAKENKCEYFILEDKTRGVLDNIMFFDVPVYITYHFDESGNTTDFELVRYINTTIEEGAEIKELTLQECHDAAFESISEFCEMFNTDFIPMVYAMGYNGGVTHINSIESFQSVYDETAYIHVSARDEEGKYWVLSITGLDGIFNSNIIKYFNVEENLSKHADISLYTEKEQDSSEL